METSTRGHNKITEGNQQRRKLTVKDKLLASASKLFYDRGMIATGVDAVIADAGVAKQSFYNNFHSKNDLMLAYLDARHKEWLELYRSRACRVKTPRQSLLAVFDAYIDHASLDYEHGFRGCGLLNAASEMPLGAEPRAVVRKHKEEVQAILMQQLLAMETEDAETKAQHLSFLLEGAMERAGLEGKTQLLKQARTIAEYLVASW